MSETPPTLPTPRPLGTRPKAYQRFMAAPMIFAALLLFAIGTLFLLALRGGEATGARVEITLAACPDALPIVEARAGAIGLGDPVLTPTDAGGALVATLPGLEGDEALIPALLAAPGALELRAGDAVVATTADLTVAQVRLDESGLPYTWIELRPAPLKALTDAIAADPEGTVDIWLDGARVAERPNSRSVADGGIRVVDVGEMPGTDRMRRAVDRSILLSHGPLPCAVTVQGVRPMAGPGSEG